MRNPWLLLLLSVCCGAGDTLTPAIHIGTSRPWPGPDFWSNPAEDWVCRDGHLENTFSGGNRNVTILTAEINGSRSAFTFRARIDQTSFDLKDEGFAGFQIGLRARSGDYREAAVSGTGFCAGIAFDGFLFIGNHRASAPAATTPFRNLLLDFRAEPGQNGTYNLILTLTDPTGTKLGTISNTCDNSWLPGLVALTASTITPQPAALEKQRPETLPPNPDTRGGDGCFRFDQIVLSGDKITIHPERAFGPILWSTQILSNDGSVYLLAQAAPFGRQEKQDAELYLDGRKISSTSVDPSSRTARFLVRHSETERDHPFEIRLAGDSWKGTIRAIPRSRPMILASLCGDEGADFPHSDLVAHVRAHKPDMIAFLGNQIHESTGGYGLIIDQHPNERAALCYLRKFMLHGWAWRDVLRDIPSLTLPAEHDVFHTRLWGENGKAADVFQGYGAAAQDGGGYVIAPELANVIHTTQTGNLPPPVDPSPCPSRISVFFTDWTFGPVHFAVINDRQFKTSPKNLLGEAEIKSGRPANPQLFLNPPKDHSAAQLLGERQEHFLARYAETRPDGTKFHAVISQSPFAAIATIRPLTEESSPAEIPDPDFGTNGWPASKRNLALQLIRSSSAVHISGGQNLATTGQYGIHGFADGPWWIAAPPTTIAATRSPARWTPGARDTRRSGQNLKSTGDFSDAFGNKFTLHAVANPHDAEAATGYAITIWDPATGRVSLANWPASSSPANPAPDNQPLPGWPVVIDPSTGKRVN